MATIRCWVCGRPLKGMYATKARGKRVCNNSVEQCVNDAYANIRKWDGIHKPGSDVFSKHILFPKSACKRLQSILKQERNENGNN